MRIARFECEDCGSEIRAEIKDVYPDGTVRPDGKYTMRGEHWFDSAGTQIPPTTPMYLIDDRLVEEPFCSACFAEMAMEIAAPSIKTTATKNMDKITRSMMDNQGMTDMRDNLRDGDIAAPALRPDLQKVADSMFKKTPATGNNAQMMAIGKSLPYDQSGKRGMNMLQTAIRQGKKL